jgi:hypothetical protein
MSKDTPPEDEEKKKKAEEGKEKIIYVDFATGRRLSKEEWSKTPEDIADELVGQEPEDFEELAVQNSIKINSLKYVAQRQQDTLDALGDMSLATAKLAGATAYETDGNSKEIKTIWSRIMSSVSTKEFRIGVIAIIAVIIGLFAWGQSQKPKQLAYKFVANYTVTKDAKLVDMIRTQAELDSVKKFGDMRGIEDAVIGAAVNIISPEKGYSIIAPQTLTSNFRQIEDMPDTKTQFDTYEFIPDAKRITVGNFTADKIVAEAQLRAIMADQRIEERELATIGSYIVKRPDGTLINIGADEDAFHFTPIADYEATKAK